jgi:energy-coupling factor transporter ATP-binding protein EcfA2
MDTIIQVNDLTKFYGTILAVDHISFEVKGGEVFGFLGPNGAGKTTTIRMMVGLTQPTSGTALIDYYDIRKKNYGVKEVFEAMTMSNFFRFPMILLCGVFFPVSSIPFPLPIISYLLPLTYTVDGLKHCLLGDQGMIPLFLDLLVLLGFAILIFALSLSIFKKRIRQEF